LAGAQSDGGKTWKIETDLPFADFRKDAKPTPLTGPVDFTARIWSGNSASAISTPDRRGFTLSDDRCKTWRGPYALAVEGVNRICTRTDLIALGPRDCLMFGSCAKESDGKEGRVFAHTPWMVD